MNMKFMELNKKIKQQLSPVYNIIGGDIFLVRQAIHILKSNIITDLEEFNYVCLEGEKLKSIELDNAILTLPIACQHRLIILDNPSNDLIKFINKYDFTDSSTILVCINTDKLSVGEIIDCTSLERSDITKYILNMLSKYNLSIEERALDYLIDATNSDMSKISNELEKLIVYSNGLDKIDMDIVTNLISDSNEYVIYMLTEAIDNRDYTKFQTILNEMSKSQSISEIFSYLGRYFKRMQYISLNKSDDELSKILNIKTYAIKIARQKIIKNGVKYYINLYQKYVDLDFKIKSGEITAFNALYELIF